MKLLSVVVPEVVHRLTQMNGVSVITANTNLDAARGWCAVLRGPSVFFVSPPGWSPVTRTVAPDAKPDAERCAIECPRSHVAIFWGGIKANAELEATAKFESPPFGPEVEAAIAAAKGSAK